MVLYLIVAEKLGAPALRIFPGKDIPENHTWDEIAGWVAEDIIECAEFAKLHGVVLEIQNHNDFLKTAEEVSKLMELAEQTPTHSYAAVKNFQLPKAIGEAMNLVKQTNKFFFMNVAALR